MRLRLESALLVCLCLWIPVAQSYGAPEDDDGSGDDAFFSGSGSGEDDIWFSESENTTKTAWYTDAPVNHPGHSVTQHVMLDPEPETSGHITEAPFLYTTQITKTQPPLVIVQTVESEKTQETERTTVSSVAQPVTTVPPAEKVPVMTTHEEEDTTADYNVEDTTESSIVDDETETAVIVEAVPEAPEMEATTSALSTTSASNSADTEASGDAVESTTVQDIADSNNDEIVPGHHEPKMKKPVDDDDFDFNDKSTSLSESSGSNSGFSQGSTDNDSLLKRKEVLAGVIAGGVVGLAFAIMLVALMVYRMKKKDEGSYSLDEHKHPNGGYQKPQKQEEFLA